MLPRLFLASLVALASIGAATAKEPRTEPQKAPKPDSAAVASGAKLYVQYCQTCHGKGGRGDGPAAAGLKPKPRDFTDRKQLKSKNDDDLYKVISKGGPALKLSAVMVGWESVLKEAQIRQIIAYIHALTDSASTGKAAGAKPAAGKKDP